MTAKHTLSDDELTRLAERIASDDFDPQETVFHTRAQLLGPLEEAVIRRTQADTEILAAIRHARGLKVPWIAIAGVLGVSHQAAMKKYKPLL
jgi:hypothetical protein